MKVNGLEGDYCPTCATALELHRQTPNRVIVLCGSVCGATFYSTGDVDRFSQTETKATSPEPEVSERRSEDRDSGETEQRQAEAAGFLDDAAKKKHK